MKSFKEIWYERNPVHEINADTGEDMFWGTEQKVAEEFCNQSGEQQGVEDAETFLKKAAKKYEFGSPFGLNKLPFVLYEAVAKVMTEYAAQQPHSTVGELEKILCAAIWYADGKKHEHQPKNIESGIVVCGRRHHNCIATKSQMVIPKGTPSEQGFITTADRFVDRKEAMELAKKSGQVTSKQSFEELYSEDLY